MMNSNPALQAQLSRAMAQAGPQQGFHHLQHPMQVSPIPQQSQQIPLNMVNHGAQMNPNQGRMQVPMNPMQAAGMGAPDMNRLTEDDKAKVRSVAMRLMATQSEDQKRMLLTDLQSRIGPQGIQGLRQAGRDPLMLAYEQQAFTILRRAANLRACRPT